MQKRWYSEVYENSSSEDSSEGIIEAVQLKKKFKLITVVRINKYSSIDRLDCNDDDSS